MDKPNAISNKIDDKDKPMNNIFDILRTFGKGEFMNTRPVISIKVLMYPDQLLCKTYCPMFRRKLSKEAAE